MAKQSIYCRGKLLISGAYGVLDGATGFAIPTRLGQVFDFDAATTTGLISTRAYDLENKPWMEASFKAVDFSPIEQETDKQSNMLSKLFKAARSLNADFGTQGFTLSSKLEFNRHWGLGSSSTLVAAVAKYAQVDPYKLLDLSFTGSGYDIACAYTKGPILYSRNQSEIVVQSIEWKPKFTDQLYLVYLNEKMNSREAISHYREQVSSEQFIQELSSYSIEISKETTCLERFESLLGKQEALLSSRLNLPTIKQSRFSDLPEGVITSLGAWGGDFALFTRQKNIPYLKDKGYQTILPLSELCLF